MRWVEYHGATNKSHGIHPQICHERHKYTMRWVGYHRVTNKICSYEQHKPEDTAELHVYLADEIRYPAASEHQHIQSRCQPECVLSNRCKNAEVVIGEQQNKGKYIASYMNRKYRIEVCWNGTSIHEAIARMPVLKQ
jgi:hypothetical protein